MTPSDACYALTRTAEGLRLEAYRDSGGVLTIGYGHTNGVHEGMTCTPEQAEAWLEEDIAEAAQAVNQLALPCTQNQFDALTDFVFNEGVGHFAGSTLLHAHKAGEFEIAAAEFGKWIYCNHRPLAGLIARRAAEARLYLGEDT